MLFQVKAGHELEIDFIDNTQAAHSDQAGVELGIILHQGDGNVGPDLAGGEGGWISDGVTFR